MLKVGLIGVGGISGTHIPAWEEMEDVELVALCDIRKSRLDKYPGKRHYFDYDEMLAKEELDIVDICLPTYLHAEYAMKALELGKHVMCEKPISLDINDVERLYEAAHRNNVNFMIGQVLRFWPEYCALKEVYDTQKYGKLLSGYMSRVGSAPRWSWDGWMSDEKRSGGVPFDLHIHDLDFIIYAFGTPLKVKNNRIKRPEQDCINAVYEFEDFYIETESAWYAAIYPFSARFRFQFEKAVMVFENGKCLIYELDGNVIDLSAPVEEGPGVINLPKTKGPANELRYFADCVNKGVFPDKVKPEELYTVLDILQSNMEDRVIR